LKKDEKPDEASKIRTVLLEYVTYASPGLLMRSR
jgi:hypothetical protein